MRRSSTAPSWNAVCCGTYSPFLSFLKSFRRSAVQRHFRLAIAFLTICGLTACNSSNPTAPSNGGVTITGSVVAPGGADASTASEPASGPPAGAFVPPGLAVAVVGTGITVPIGAAGQFVLSGVPAGTVQLRFTAPGTSATLTLTGLEAGQQVTISISLTPSSAAIQSEHRSGGGGLNVNGILSNFTGTSDAFEFMVNGQLVKGDAQTEFFGNSHFSELANGQRVEVKGSQRVGFVYAVRIHVNDPDDEDDEDEDNGLTGVIAGPPSGVSPNLTFVVGSTTVTTNSATVVQRKSDKSQTPAQLQAGMTVEVSGNSLPNGTVVAKKIHITGDAVGGLFQMTANMGGQSGTCPTLSFKLNGYDIVTTGATIFVPNCSTVSNGKEVKVLGIVQAGGSVTATRVERQ
jgi:hypothetical protein